MTDSDQSLSVLIKQYALDLRRNASGGDDYPYEYAKATADYLEELIKRAKGNCTCVQAGFPDSCDNCDGLAPCQQQPVAWRWKVSPTQKNWCWDEVPPPVESFNLEPLYAAPSDTSTDPNSEDERTKLSNERKRLRRWGIGQ